jgi:hypothetical protein
LVLATIYGCCVSWWVYSCAGWRAILIVRLNFFSFATNCAFSGGP